MNHGAIVFAKGRKTLETRYLVQEVARVSLGRNSATKGLADSLCQQRVNRNLALMFLTHRIERLLKRKNRFARFRSEREPIARHQGDCSLTNSAIPKIAEQRPGQPKR